jgi:hypothetical protein
LSTLRKYALHGANGTTQMARDIYDELDIQ